MGKTRFHSGGDIYYQHRGNLQLVHMHAFRSVFITCRTFFGTCTSSNRSSEGRTHNWGANSISCTHRASKRICKTKTTCRFSNRNLGLRSLFKRIQRAQTKLSGEVDAPTSRQKLLSKTWNLFCLVHTCAPTEDLLSADNIWLIPRSRFVEKTLRKW